MYNSIKNGNRTLWSRYRLQFLIASWIMAKCFWRIMRAITSLVARIFRSDLAATHGRRVEAMLAASRHVLTVTSPAALLFANLVAFVGTSPGMKYPPSADGTAGKSGLCKVRIVKIGIFQVCFQPIACIADVVSLSS